MMFASPESLSERKKMKKELAISYFMGNNTIA